MTSASEVQAPVTASAPPPRPPAGPTASATAVPSATVVEPRDTRERARLSYLDEEGPHVFLMRKDALSIGRGGTAAWVDVQIMGSSKVSREHVRLRVDAEGRFFIQDVSLWGTSVDGVAVAPAVKNAEGVTQPGPEQPLPPKARIGLADAVLIEFEAVLTK